MSRYLVKSWKINWLELCSAIKRLSAPELCYRWNQANYDYPNTWIPSCFKVVNTLRFHKTIRFDWMLNDCITWWKLLSLSRSNYVTRFFAVKINKFGLFWLLYTIQWIIFKQCTYWYTGCVKYFRTNRRLISIRNIQ